MLEVADLNVFYGKVQALEKVSIRVKEGEIFTVIGANGAGKTTLLRTILGLKKPIFGSIYFKGEDITDKPCYKRIRMGIGIVPEARGLFPYFSVLENLLMGAYPRRDRISDDLDRVYQLFPILRERRRQLAKTLSGGEGQMLAIGRALMANPRMLLMDEPSMGLMPTLVTEIFEAIQRLNQLGTTILLVEQNAKKALSIAKIAAVLELGRISLLGDPNSLRDDPRVKKAYLGG